MQNKNTTQADKSKETEKENITSKSGHKITSKQVVAIIGVLLLVAMYVVTLVVAFIDQSAVKNMFQGCILATVAIPALIWFYIWMYGRMTGRKTMADFEKEE